MSTNEQDNNLPDLEDGMKTISFRCPLDEALKLKVLAAQKNTTNQTILRELVTAYLEREKAVNG